MNFLWLTQVEKQPHGRECWVMAGVISQEIGQNRWVPGELQDEASSSGKIISELVTYIVILWEYYSRQIGTSTDFHEVHGKAKRMNDRCATEELGALACWIDTIDGTMCGYSVNRPEPKLRFRERKFVEHESAMSISQLKLKELSLPFFNVIWILPIRCCFVVNVRWHLMIVIMCSRYCSWKGNFISFHNRRARLFNEMDI